MRCCYHEPDGYSCIFIDDSLGAPEGIRARSESSRASVSRVSKSLLATKPPAWAPPAPWAAPPANGDVAVQRPFADLLQHASRPQLLGQVVVNFSPCN